MAMSAEPLDQAFQKPQLRAWLLDCEHWQGRSLNYLLHDASQDDGRCLSPSARADDDQCRADPISHRQDRSSRASAFEIAQARAQG